MFDNVKKQFAEELEEIRESGMWKQPKTITGLQGAEITVDGKQLLNFCGNNYLGLAGSEEMAAPAKEGLDKYGFGMASVRFICGTSTVHIELEAEVAKFFGLEAAILYTSCFDANTGLFETILKEGNAIFTDSLNHASIIDGMKLLRGVDKFIFENSNMADLEDKLKAAGPRRRILIATDGVFSMDGITAKLKEICDLADKYGALVMVDDSHASGVLGATGRGSIEQAGVIDRIDILTSTFGKALGGAGGGFTAGRKEIIEVLHQRSRTTLFSNSLPPMIANAALYTLRNYDSSIANRRKQLEENTAYFRAAMEKLGFNLGGDGKHPITPVMLMDEKLATEMAAKLVDQGIYVRGFTYPVVPKGKARIRAQISAAHTKDQMDKAVAAFVAVGQEMGVIK